MSCLSQPTMRILFVTLALLVLQTPAAHSDAGENSESIFDAFYSTGLDTTTAYAVRNLSIQKDNMKLLLKKGTVFLMKPIDGEVTGAAFIGEGEASMTPPNRTERYMLRKHIGAARLKMPFTEAVFRFCDDTEETLLAAGHADPAGLEQADRATTIFDERSRWQDELRGLNLENLLFEIRMSDLEGLDFFGADILTADHEWVSFYHDPQSIHENFLGDSDTTDAKTRKYLITWTSWHTPSDYGPQGHYLRNPDSDGPQMLRVKRTEMNLNLEDTRVVQWDARLLIEPLVDGLRCLRFDLANNTDGTRDWNDSSFHPVSVLSVTDASGEPLRYHHRKDNLMVIVPRPTRAGEPITLRVVGRAEVIQQLTAESFGLSQAPWYPQYGFLGGRGSFDWTVRVPRPYLITGSGRVVRTFEDKETRQNGIEMVCDMPVHFPWVIFGRFRKAESTYVGENSSKPVPMTIHSFPNMTVPITDHDILEMIGATAPITLTLSAPSRKVSAFFEEGKEVLKLYEKIYGPYPYDELHIAQMAPFLGFGQSPQGFVQLTGEAFMSQARLESDFFHGFYAHEIAHQWWAHQIGWASPDDEWLSESFAEYAAGIFVNEFQGPKRFQQKLDGWKKNAEISDREAPIAAARRLLGPVGGARDRRNLLYNKGPYVLHMLRVQLDDEKYMKVMRSVQEHYRNQNISTEQLLAEINRVTGADFTYFFDQWFWDVGIPTFRYSWRSKRQPDGKVLVTVHVAQDDKDRLKRVLMPVHFHFKGGTSIPRYFAVAEAEQDLKIVVPEEPKDITLDDEHTLLADIVKAS